jgi:hypothetical protein
MDVLGRWDLNLDIPPVVRVDDSNSTVSASNSSSISDS